MKKENQYLHGDHNDNKPLIKYRPLLHHRQVRSDGDATYSTISDSDIDTNTGGNDKGHSTTNNIDNSYKHKNRPGNMEISSHSHLAKTTSPASILQKEETVVTNCSVDGQKKTTDRLQSMQTQDDTTLPVIQVYKVNSPLNNHIPMLSVDNVDYFNKLNTKECGPSSTNSTGLTTQDINRSINDIVSMIQECSIRNEDDIYVNQFGKTELSSSHKSDSYQTSASSKGKSGFKNIIKTDDAQQKQNRDVASRFNIIQQKDYWIGDPVAVTSVRRPCVSSIDIAKSNGAGQIKDTLSIIHPFHRCSRQNKHILTKIVNKSSSSPNKCKIDKEVNIAGWNICTDSLAAILSNQEEFIRKHRKHNIECKTLSSTAQIIDKEFNFLRGRKPVTATAAVYNDVNNQTRLAVGFKYKPLQRTSIKQS